MPALFQEIQTMHDDHFDGDFSSDFAALLSRRTLMLGGAAILLAACDGGAFGNAEVNIIGKASDGSSCIKLPAETAGPFPADGTNRLSGAVVNMLDQSGVIREDLRSSFAGLSDVADGVPMQLTLRLVNVSGGCGPLADHVIYLWHCDAAGQYSIYEPIIFAALPSPTRMGLRVSPRSSPDATVDAGRICISKFLKARKRR
jgi:hypothetical protein